jgi:hypothetical protein
MAAVTRLLVTLLVLALGAGTAAATPVDGVRAEHAGGAIVVTARVTSPVGGGCAVSVHAGWAPVRAASRAGAREAQADGTVGVATGLVRKTDPDGGVTVDACAESGTTPLRTHGRVRLSFRPGRIAPGRYRVCVRASQWTGTRVDADRACTVLRVGPA